jgi:uncharacterized protein (UPF0332 family)
MNEDVERHFIKALESIREAETLISSNLYKASVGHSYNAMLQAAMGALQANKIESVSRQTIYSAIEDAFIKTGRLDKKFINYLRNAEHARIDNNDTPSATIEFRQAQMVLVKSREFIAECRKLCQ